MSERYYDARDGKDRFRVQYPHMSGDYAVLDWEQGSLVALGYEDHALGMAEALNAAVNPEVDELDLVTALREVNPIHQWRVMEHLTYLVRAKMQEGFRPAINTASLEKVDDKAAHRITEALAVAVYPREVDSSINVLGLKLFENPNDALKIVPDEQKWRVSLMLARFFRQSLE